MLERMKEAAADGLKLPGDVVLGEVLVTFSGRRCVTVENYRGILIYNDETVKLQIKHGKLEIKGKRLRVDSYTHEEMKITGQIRSLEFGD